MYTDKYYCFICRQNHLYESIIGKLHRYKAVEKRKSSVFDLDISLPVTKADKYHPKYPKVDVFIKEMTPDEYLSEILKYEKFNINREEYQKVKDYYLKIGDSDKLDKYSEDMKKLKNNPFFKKGIDKFPMVMLEQNCKGETVANDGVHRVFAAKMVGIKKIPVYIVRERKRIGCQSLKP